MLKSVNRKFVIFSFLLYSYFAFYVSKEYAFIYFFSILTIFVFYVLIASLTHLDAGSYNLTRLIFIALVYSFFAVSAYNILSYYYTGNFFVFDETDPLFYHNASTVMANQSMKDAIKWYLSFMKIDALGAVLVISTLYRIIASNLFLNMFYVLVNLFTAVAIYRIGMSFMSRKYAFLAAITYTTSSFVLWFHSSGRKESIMILLIILFFERYYIFLKNKKIMNIILMFVYSLLLVLFRIPVMFFCFASIGMAFVFSKKRGVGGIALFILSPLIFIWMVPFLSFSVDKYTYGGNFETLIHHREVEEMVKGSVPFTYAANSLAQLIGPLPTLSPDHSLTLSCHAPGLIYRCLLSIPFLFGTYYAFRLQIYTLFPLLFFIFFEMISLSMVLEGLELRKSLPHIWAVYIVAFWFIYKCDKFELMLGRSKMKRLYSLSTLVLLMLIFLWNLRFSMI
jgi:hypothetical protein